MEELNRETVRRTFRWPGAAREFVRAYLGSAESRDHGPGGHLALKALITRIVPPENSIVLKKRTLQA